MTAGPFPVVCPDCRGALRDGGPASLRCSACGAEYEYVNGVPDLIRGERFPDAAEADRDAYEERSSQHTARHYLLPLFRGLFAGLNRPPRVLSVGCGTGSDVDVLNEGGMEAAGIDCGNRTGAWPRRESAGRFYLANAQRLPFGDGTFDVAYCGCVFPHVGVEGDTNRVAHDYREQRLAVAREMVRVVRPGGYILVSSPNRACPVDLFHGRSATRALPRLNPPSSRFLLSSWDYLELFGQAGCSRAELLPAANYWGFVNRNATWRGRATVWPVKAVFALGARRRLAFLRDWPISPWLVMLLRKAPA